MNPDHVAGAILFFSFVGGVAGFAIGWYSGRDSVWTDLREEKFRRKLYGFEDEESDQKETEAR